MNDLNEFDRIQSLLQIERELWNAGIHHVAGVDEAGRGPLAGPVVAAAVIFPPEIFIPGVNDSKLLSAALREKLSDRILKQAVGVGIGEASPWEIDALNILNASLLAMKRAVANLALSADYLLVDGNYKLPDCSLPQMALIKGDRRCFSIAAASIVAKVHRDRLMRDYHRIYPHYQFDQHKGYPTRVHIAAIEKHGYCRIHRRSFTVKGLNAAFEKNRQG